MCKLWSGSAVLVFALAALHSRPALAECKDLLLRMQDPNGKSAGRELTMFMNCHGGSYQIPEATTINVFEWKHGSLCHAHRVCGNAWYWNGHFGIGAAWSWGNSVSNFASNTDFVNNFIQLAEGAQAGNGGRGGNGGSVDSNVGNINTGSLCINRDDSNTGNIGLVNSGASASASGRCYQASIFQPSEWDQYCNSNYLIGMQPRGGSGGRPNGMGLTPFTITTIPGHPSYGNVSVSCSQVAANIINNSNNNNKYICINGASARSYAELDQRANSLHLQGIAACNENVSNDINISNSAGNGGNGGAGGDGYSPIFGLGSGTSNTTGNVDTDWDATTVHVNFALDFGQIERYCGPKMEEVCF